MERGFTSRGRPYGSCRSSRGRPRSLQDDGPGLQYIGPVGKMHNYMRMYWGKKILEWNPSPEESFRTALYLNNKYELDGRDPNGFTGVAWCFGKHDRPWGGRRIFGNVRYMNDAGLRRKFKIDDYVRKVEAMQ